MSKRILIICSVVLLILVAFIVFMMAPPRGKVTAKFLRYEDERTVTIMLVNGSNHEIEYWGENGWSIVNASRSLKRGAATEVRLSYPSSTLPTATVDLGVSSKSSASRLKIESLLQRVPGLGNVNITKPSKWFDISAIIAPTILTNGNIWNLPDVAMPNGTTVSDQ